MLILSRKPGESIVIDGRIIVKIVRVEGEIVKIGIEAPAELPVHRQEVYEEIQRNNEMALTRPKARLPKLARHKPAASEKPALPERSRPESAAPSSANHP